MAIMRWRPWDGPYSVQQELNRLFDNFYDRVPEEREWPAQRWNPAVDISESNGDFHVDVEIPGMNKEDIKISLENNVLMLKGEKKQEREFDQDNCHRLERSYGSFVRSFELPVPVQADKIKASYKNGVLKIDLPKAEEVKPKEIPIEVK